MRKPILTVTLCFLATVAFAQAAATWEVRKRPNGSCEVVRVAASAPGTRVAGPFKNRKRAEDELIRLRRGPKCKR
jgi:hypothetical protein